MSLPPTLDEAIRLVRRQHGSITIGELADAVLDRGWTVDRNDLLARIRELYPAPILKQPATAPPLTTATAPPPPTTKAKIKGRGQPEPPRKKKRPKSKATQEYCPRCHAFVVMTRLEGVTTIAQHLTKKGSRCPMSGQQYVRKPLVKKDALEFRVPGSFGTGKRR